MYPTIPHAVLKGQSRNTWPRRNDDANNTRRTIYTFIKRSLIDPFVESFDAATTDTSCAVRFQTTQPTQALTMLNSEFINRAAADLAARLKREAGEDSAAQVTLALRLVTGRTPDEKTVQAGVHFLESFPDPVDPDQPLRQYCLIALNLNELVFLD